MQLWSRVTTTPLYSLSKWSPNARNTWAREQRICFRCLRTGHWASNCRPSVVCAQCSRKHHSLLHPDGPVHRPRDDNITSSSQLNPEAASSLVSQLKSPSIILGTPLVHIQDSSGALHTVRALIDSASQISAITFTCASRLGLRMTKWTAPVSSLAGSKVHNVMGLVKCQIQPRFAEDPMYGVDAWVFPSIIADMPQQPLSHSVADKFKHLALADPSFVQPGPIDILLGAELFALIMNGKRVLVCDAYPVAFGTVFGWIVIGPVPHSRSQGPSSCPATLTTSVETLLENFWKLEEPEAAPEEFTSDGQCEVMFRERCVRDASGRFNVPLLFRQPVFDTTFRGERAVAEKRFEQLERKLVNDDRLKALYCDFMAEYLSLGHMSLATSAGSYFIPHHAIYRESNTEPKLEWF